MPDFVMISPNYDVTKITPPVSIDDYIDIYEDRIKLWIIEPAKTLSKYKHGGYAILYLLASYFESYAVYINGEKSKGKSKDYFKQGFLSVFSDIAQPKYSELQINEISKIMYEDFRCGLYHDGFPRGIITLVEGKFPISFETNSQKEICAIQIDTYKFIRAIEVHSYTYICNLRKKENVDLRKNFEKAFLLLYK